jgi:hypothetical protein
MNRFSKFFITAVSALQEPRLWQAHNERGQTQWHVYDPHVKEHRHLDSEEAVRVWFEQRHHQSDPSVASRLYFETAFDGVR